MTSEDILDLKLKQIENKSLSNKSAIITQAQTLEQNDDTKNEAIYMWQRVAQSSSLGDVTFVQSIYAISQLHFQLGEFDKSLSVIEDSLEYTHNVKHIRQTQCVVLEKLGRLDEAENISKEYDLSDIEEVIGESISRKEERDREEALKALKDTSDRFLGMFGLNTNMLNINESDDGKYSFKINK